MVESAVRFMFGYGYGFDRDLETEISSSCANSNSVPGAPVPGNGDACAGSPSQRPGYISPQTFMFARSEYQYMRFGCAGEGRRGCAAASQPSAVPRLAPLLASRRSLPRAAPRLAPSCRAPSRLAPLLASRRSSPCALVLHPHASPQPRLYAHGRWILHA